MPTSLRINVLAVMRSTATLAVSEGWKEKKPKSIQRWEPNTSLPTPGISTSRSGTIAKA